MISTTFKVKPLTDQDLACKQAVHLNGFSLLDPWTQFYGRQVTI